MDRVIADSVRHIPHVGSFDDLAATRFSSIDFTPFFIYMIDTVPSQALPFLAEMFDVLGYKGWRYADTEQKQRDLIKKAISLHRRAGTPWAIKESIFTTFGTRPKIVEGIFLQYNGVADYNGLYNYSSGSVFLFRVIVDHTAFVIINQQLIEDLTQLILAWKNARSTLLDVSFSADQGEQLGAVDRLDILVDHPSNHSLDYSFTL